MGDIQAENIEKVYGIGNELHKKGMRRGNGGKGA